MADDDPVYGSFEDFGDEPASALTTGGLDLGGQLKLPDSLTDPTAQPDAKPDYTQPTPPEVEDEPDNLLERGYQWVKDWLDDGPQEPAPIDPIEQQRIEDDKTSGSVLDEHVVDTPEIDI
jgi:hypothetical protein